VSYFFNVLADNYAHNTIRIKVCYQEKNLVVLINIGSTHNFIDVVVVKEIKAIVVKTTVLTVTITNDSFLRCDSHCPKLTWLFL